MLFTFIRSLFSSDLLIELSESKITIKAFSSNLKYEDEPYIAIEKTNKSEIVKDIGTTAKNLASATIKVTNPFKHSRSFIGDFLLAEKILQHGVYSIKKSFIRPAPRVIIHQLEKVEGGLTHIETRVLRELAFGIGARETLIHIGDKINSDIESYNSVKARLKAI